MTTTTLKTPAGYRILSPAAAAEIYGAVEQGYYFEPADYEGGGPFSVAYPTRQAARAAAYDDRTLVELGQDDARGCLIGH